MFIANISQAFGALAAVRERGLNVPRDLSLVWLVVLSIAAFVIARLSLPLTVEAYLHERDAVLHQLFADEHRFIPLVDARHVRDVHEELVHAHPSHDRAALPSHKHRSAIPQVPPPAVGVAHGHKPHS